MFADDEHRGRRDAQLGCKCEHRCGLKVDGCNSFGKPLRLDRIHAGDRAAPRLVLEGICKPCTQCPAGRNGVSLREAKGCGAPPDSRTLLREAVALPIRPDRPPRNRCPPGWRDGRRALPGPRARSPRSAHPFRSPGSSAPRRRGCDRCSPRARARGCSSSAARATPGRAAAPGRDRRRGSRRRQTGRWGGGAWARTRRTLSGRPPPFGASWPSPSTREKPACRIFSMRLNTAARAIHTFNSLV